MEIQLETSAPGRHVSRPVRRSVGVDGSYIEA